MKVTSKVALLVLLASVGVMAQSAAPSSPCSAADLRAQIAEARLEARRVEVNGLNARLAQLEQELAKQKGLTGDAEQRAGIAQKNADGSRTLASSLAASNATAQQRIAALEANLAEQDKVIAADRSEIAQLTGERDAALRKIVKANHKRGCRWFHVGCISER